jgi:ferredoxin
MLYIDPEHCIDCDACAPECPVEAIFQEMDVPAKWQSFVALNAARVAALQDQGAHITERQEPMAGSGCAK